MKVPEYLARDIVERMKEIINQDINYIDTNSIIIASTDERRIGTFHGGARRVLASRNEVIIHQEGEYAGTKRGINLPVYFENRIVGVIGITGREEEVGRYGKIIQSMTEILIKEAYIVEQENIGRESKRQFIEELLFRRHKGDENSLKIRSELLNIKIDIPRIVIVARVYGELEKNLLITPSIYEKVYNFIKSYIDFNAQNLTLQSGMNYIMILDINGLKDVYTLLDNICQRLEEKYHIKICFGIGNNCTKPDEMRKSYKEARKALDVALVSQEKSIIRYSELDIELLLDAIPKMIKDEFSQKIFKNIECSDIDDIVEFLIKYIKNNGSINKTAEELHFHKNTVQYRINKIKTLTGYDPRNIEDMAVLYIAVMLYLLEK